MFYIFDKKIGIMKNYLEVVNKIMNSKNISGLNIYTSEDEYWEYYLDLTGYYNDNYFNVVFSNCLVDNIDEIQISKNTLSLEEFKKEFNL